MFFQRNLLKVLARYAKFPVCAILGPRQSGKTTLARHYFKEHLYVNLENLELRSFAVEDPLGFLSRFNNKKGLIIDEFQYAPQLLSYIQVEVDEKKRAGYFVLITSHNFLANPSITQSLAGRVGILTLLPLSLHELKVNHLTSEIDTLLLQGAYPRLYKERLSAVDFSTSYLHTYLERDIHQITDVGDILVFHKFMRLCAARIGQLLNISELAAHLGISQRKVREWIAVLEASYIIFRLKPYFKNFNKRLTKTPKLYFYDTGLACSLLGIKTEEALQLSCYRGALFESFIIAELQKQYHHGGLGNPSTYFWRDQNGRIEVNCVINRGDALFPIEIKSGTTITPQFFISITEWNKITKSVPKHSSIIYGGDQTQQRSQGKVMGWEHASQFVTDLYQPEKSKKI